MVASHQDNGTHLALAQVGELLPQLVRRKSDCVHCAGEVEHRLNQNINLSTRPTSTRFKSSLLTWAGVRTVAHPSLCSNSITPTTSAGGSIHMAFSLYSFSPTSSAEALLCLRPFRNLRMLVMALRMLVCWYNQAIGSSSLMFFVTNSSWCAGSYTSVTQSPRFWSFSINQQTPNYVISRFFLTKLIYASVENIK